MEGSSGLRVLVCPSLLGSQAQLHTGGVCLYLGEFGDQDIWKRVSLKAEGAEAGCDSVGVGCLSGKTVGS